MTLSLYICGSSLLSFPLFLPPSLPPSLTITVLSLLLAFSASFLLFRASISSWASVLSWFFLVMKSLSLRSWSITRCNS